jgi:hypothetical protein
MTLLTIRQLEIARTSMSSLNYKFLPKLENSKAVSGKLYKCLSWYPIFQVDLKNYKETYVLQGGYYGKFELSLRKNWEFIKAHNL